MYYSNILHPELQQFHKIIVPNFTIKLTDILTSDLFKVETIITGSIYRIYPLFYANEITSSNPDDNILDTQCIVCQKTSDETYITFISNPSEPINDYSNYASYFDVGDSLTTSEFNNIVALLRHNTIHNDPIRINDLVTGVYGTYEFDITDTTVLDNGIVVSDETITAEPRVRLTNPTFNKSTYTLQLKVLHYTDVNILDDSTDDYTVIDTLEIELLPDEWIPIPVTDIEQGYIILFNSNVEITHDKNIIQNWTTTLHLTAQKQLIQTGDHDDITVKATDDLETPIPSKVIYFFEAYEPSSIKLTASPNTIISGEVSDITAILKDHDGSLIQSETVYFYIEEEV